VQLVKLDPIDIALRRVTSQPSESK